MKIYVFGNRDQHQDNRAFAVADKLKMSIERADFVFVEPNDDLTAEDGEKLIIMDTVAGINEITLFSKKDLDVIDAGSSTTVHDYDLGLQLKYLEKLGKLKSLTIVGVPQTGKINYRRIQSILRKLVAQDIQGS